MDTNFFCTGIGGFRSINDKGDDMEMEYKIIADSCCDMTPELREELDVTSVPLTLTLGEKSYVDDETLDLPAFMVAMKNCKDRIGSACPSPAQYCDTFEKDRTSFVVTLSNNLSGSHGSAVLGKKLAKEEKNAEVHVLDSKSASAGEILITLKLRQWIEKGFKTQEILAKAHDFIDHMKTYFVLDSVENLMKNGRLNKVVGKIITVLHVKPLMGADGNGNISLFSHARGDDQIVTKMTDTITKSGKKTGGQNVVITHCNNPTLAEKLKASIQKNFDFSRILVVPTKGLSSVYANDKGIIMAF